MIQNKKLFTPVASLEAAEAKNYLASHAEGTFTLLDVRQPGEYEEAHIPGATLIPLPQLNDRYQELDPEKPTLVHCAIGGRSRVAAQLLAGMGFKEVYNLAGGIKAFKGQKAAGPRELNLEMIRGDESPSAVVVLAYGMEKGLQTFHEAVAAQTADADLAVLCRQLAHIEELHEERLAGLYRQLEPEGKDLPALMAEREPALMEGGFKPREFLQQNAAWMKSLPEMLELAMMLETQALDLYLRFAAKLTHPETQEVLYTLAQEEKAHLARLAALWEEKAGKPGSS
ncbi:MAG: rhodanese-like domain-containing protein [Thermodesulfobacteriota bacterium]